MRNEELIHEEERGGFTIRFYAEPEDLSPRDEFMIEDGSDDEETIRKIENGTYAWFCAHVVASKAGVELGDDYLGACCYESAQAFVTPGEGYWEDMVANALDQAKAKFAELCK